MTITIRAEGPSIGKGVFVTKDEHEAWEHLSALTDPWRPGTRITVEVGPQ